ncbi:DUF1003 domain-containing protein [Rouxiella sp. T17]|uniref:DUF1003 domain-containing protein n=1 Tax=Rouxiella sp. T17 TaxID=3085684 RepID=UPI002FC6868B
MAHLLDDKDKEHLSVLRGKSTEEHELLIRDPKDSESKSTFGDRLAEKITGGIATWKFILAQTGMIAGWTGYNILIKKAAFDPFPFILLNLFLSFQSAYTAPAIMMNQKRQAKNDQIRNEMESDINVKADLEISQLNEKMDKIVSIDMYELKQQIIKMNGLLNTLTSQNSKRQSDKESN